MHQIDVRTGLLQPIGFIGVLFSESIHGQDSLISMHVHHYLLVVLVVVGMRLLIGYSETVHMYIQAYRTRSRLDIIH